MIKKCFIVIFILLFVRFLVYIFFSIFFFQYLLWCLSVFTNIVIILMFVLLFMRIFIIFIVYYYVDTLKLKLCFNKFKKIYAVELWLIFILICRYSIFHHLVNILYYTFKIYLFVLNRHCLYYLKGYM